MSNVLVISGSPSPTSKTELLAGHVARRLAEYEWRAGHLRVRTLPAAPLLRADPAEPAIAAAVERVARADGIVLATPAYKASFSGLLKTFLDVLPQYGFTGKAVLPLATGGSPAHVLMLDYALRPVVHSLGARHVVQGFFLLDTHLEPDVHRGTHPDTPTVAEGGPLRVRPESARMLDEVIEQFRKALIAAP
ncbi:NADPH-dependent FMN reductase [Streptomyces sp. LP05-1]|uniref:NADPH-dependent FMN reductase n=1 Tax=Streptomyces pyxinae TaxID=2970734 RepID=A0ABT2CQR4_9ACTN|nr:NADPH-dependent FMN reductase [Streptomyces sp. LP05-1]MCS0639773.1 NADPH-dependent FMN reductase [Streptomyces sp. LP05-1]